MEKQDRYKLSIQRSRIMAAIGVVGIFMFFGLLFLGIPIFINSIRINQLNAIITTQFPDQELYSVAQYIAHQDTLNLVLYIGVGCLYIALIVWLFIRLCRICYEYAEEIEMMSEQLERLQQQHPLELPKAIDTERAQKYLKKAIDAHLIESTETGLRRVQANCTKTQLVYLLNQIYCVNPTDKFPNDELCKLFGEARMDKILYDIFCNHTGKPAHAEGIDRIFME
ncbi:MAG: hypothetical protein KBS70_06205 [Bacteroidales bacterium]|nr:hypothetical protein [Candidatus Colicola equi]